MSSDYDIVRPVGAGIPHVYWDEEDGDYVTHVSVMTPHEGWDDTLVKMKINECWEPIDRTFEPGWSRNDGWDFMGNEEDHEKLGELTYECVRDEKNREFQIYEKNRNRRAIDVIKRELDVLDKMNGLWVAIIPEHGMIKYEDLDGEMAELEKVEEERGVEMLKDMAVFECEVNLMILRSYPPEDRHAPSEEYYRTEDSEYQGWTRKKKLDINDRRYMVKGVDYEVSKYPVNSDFMYEKLYLNELVCCYVTILHNPSNRLGTGVALSDYGFVLIPNSMLPKLGKNGDKMRGTIKSTGNESVPFTLVKLHKTRKN